MEFNLKKKTKKIIETENLIYQSYNRLREEEKEREKRLLFCFALFGKKKYFCLFVCDRIKALNP